MKPGHRKTITTIIKIIVSAGALIYVFSKIELAQVAETFVQTNFLLIPFAILLFVLSKAIAAQRLNKLFRVAGISLSASLNMKLYLLGMYYNLFLPGGIGGDGYKIFILKKIFHVKAGRVFQAVLLDRLSGMVALFCLGMLIAGFLNFNVGFDTRFLSFLLIPVSLTGFYFLLRFFFSDFSRLYLRIISLSLSVQVLQTLCALVLLFALNGKYNMAEYLFLFLVSSIVAMLPLTVGGAGLREVTFLFGSAMFGLDESLSITLSLAFYLITLFTSFWGIIYSLKTDYFERQLKQGKTIAAS